MLLNESKATYTDAFVPLEQFFHFLNLSLIARPLKGSLSYLSVSVSYIPPHPNHVASKPSHYLSSISFSISLLWS